MSHVFMHKRKIYLWGLDHCPWSITPTVLSQPWCELILLWSLVSFNVVVVFVLFWRRHSYELVFCGGLLLDHELFDLVVAIFFRLYFWPLFVSFRGDEDGWWLCSGSVICSENLESSFLNWKYGFFNSGVVLLDAYLDSTWLVISWCCSKGLGV